MKEETKLRTILFGDEIRKVNIVELAERLGEKPDKVYRWRRHPLTMKTWQLIEVANCIGLSDAEIIQIFKIAR